MWGRRRRTIASEAKVDRSSQHSVTHRGMPKPGLLLAHKWEDGDDPAGWWMSEKLDRVRESTATSLTLL